MKGNKNIILFVIFILFGIVVMLQFRSIINSIQLKELSKSDFNELSYQLDIEKKISKTLRQQIKDIEIENETLINSIINNNNDTILKEIKKELDLARLKAGLTDVKGQGIIITLNDAPARNGMQVKELIIHDSDIITILNDLKKAGVQAISINDERVIATSKQVCAGPTILINQNRYPVPYVIKAIGDKDKLYEIINSSERVVIMKNCDIQVEIEKSNDIFIERYQIVDYNRLLSGLEVVD